MILKNKKNFSETTYAKKVYKQIICLAVIVHLSYVFIFGFLSFLYLSIYNIISVIFYLIMLIIIKKGFYCLIVTLIHIEVSLFVILCTILGGWEIGIYLYLVALASLVYFCPFNYKYIPYLFSTVEICLFILLKLYITKYKPYYSLSGIWINSILYLYNALACFIIILYSAYSSDVSASVTKKKLQDENKNLSVIANYDQLTGLLNRYAFFQKADEYNKTKIILSIGDIDDFKKFNDTYGHNCGDYILRKIAELMRKLCGNNVDICRWGGEEFVFLFHDISIDIVKEKMQYICSEIAKFEFQYENYYFHITMTFGISENYGINDISSIVKIADEKMYKGKTNGKNQVVF